MLKNEVSSKEISIGEEGIEALGTIAFVITDDQFSETFRTWKGLMNEFHYLRSGPLFGKRIHYLVNSSNYGWIGGLSFSASAILLKDRDELIGWNKKERTKNLCKVVSNSRFLILPHLQVKNLASHLLSRCLKRLKKDWHEKYQQEVVLVESFVEKERFIGTSYRAANWLHIGSTKGRGRDGKSHAPVKPVKDIYLYPLVKQWKADLRSEDAEEPRRKFSNWVEEELYRVNFKDKRHVSRLLNITSSFYDNPGASINQSVAGDRYKSKAAYRFFENERTVAQRYEVIESHKKATAERMQSEKTVLAVQDSTGLNYTRLKSTEGLGYIGDRKDGPSGLYLHDTLAFTTKGVPLGILDAQVWSRDNDNFGKRHQRKKRPIEEKESIKWLKSFRAVEEVKKECPNTTIVSVGDREADIYELFELSAQSKVHLLVRALQNRVLHEEQKKLWDKMAAAPRCGIQDVVLPPSKSYKKQRTANLTIRFGEVRITPKKTSNNKQPIHLYAVWAKEENPPAGATPLDWKLLTTVEVAGHKSAQKVLKWYAKRWGIEVFHRTLKSGLKVENQYFSKAERIELRLYIYMIIAWRVFYLNKMGRETPGIQCSIFF